jgi:hypothetical protein
MIYLYEIKQINTTYPMPNMKIGLNVVLNYTGGTIRSFRQRPTAPIRLIISLHDGLKIIFPGNLQAAGPAARGT